MAGNKTKSQRIHDLMPKFFKTQTNPNWKALIEAMGEVDQELAVLLENVREQFFIDTASRPWIDRLGANVKVSRPRFVGMGDDSFRRYIPALSYQPKQVKKILDDLLDIFFFRDTTTAFNQTLGVEPFFLVDEWDLDYLIDGQHLETISFRADDFSDIQNATAEEIVNSINRQAKHSFAVTYDDRIAKQIRIRLFSNTIGSKGSVQVVGGKSNLSLQFNGFYANAGSTASTQWNVTKIGDTMTFQQVGGSSINLNQISEGDVVISTIPGNEGSFTITSIDLANLSFQYVNLFGTAGFYDQALLQPYQVIKFMQPSKMVVYTNSSRAVVWETTPGEVIVEMPATPPVVKRSLKGSGHLNGMVAKTSSVPSSTSLILDDATDWPTQGKFILQQIDEIQSHIITITEDSNEFLQMNTRFKPESLYSFTGRSGNTLTGISPALPTLADMYEVNISSASRDAFFTVTSTTATPHGFTVGEGVCLYGTQGPLASIGLFVPILLSDTVTTIANKTAVTLSAYSDFSATSLGADVTITNTSNGVTTDAGAGTSGSTITMMQQGTTGLPEITKVTLAGGGSFFDVAGAGKYFEIYSANDNTFYHVWYFVSDGVNTQTNPSIAPIDGTFTIQGVPTPTTFTFLSPGETGTVTGGTARVERIGMAGAGAFVYLTSSRVDTGIYGPYMWSSAAPYVISSLTADIQQQVKAGSIIRTLQISSPNNIPDSEGFVIFGFGTEKEEGPVRYLYKPTANSLQMDPAYTFQYTHNIGDAVTMIRRKGAHIMSGSGKEYPLYITDPGVARETLQVVMRDVKSVGIFIEFIVRYPELLYNTLDVYKSANPNLWPVNDEEKAKLTT